MFKNVNILSNRIILTVLTGLFSIAIIVSYFSYYWSTLIDDAFISFTYGRNWLEHGEFVFNLGERVEGYSNFFWIVSLIVGKVIGLNFALGARLISGVLIVAMVAIIVFVNARSQLRIPLIFQSLILASYAEIAYWGCSGLEGVFFSFALFLGVLLISRDDLGVRAILMGIVSLVLATLIRPEGLFFALVCLTGGFLISRGNDRRWIIASVLVYTALIIPYHLWRLSYFKPHLLNSIHAKSGWSIFAVISHPFSWIGWELLEEYASTNWILSIYLLIGNLLCILV